MILHQNIMHEYKSKPLVLTPEELHMWTQQRAIAGDWHLVERS